MRYLLTLTLAAAATLSAQTTQSAQSPDLPAGLPSGLPAFRLSLLSLAAAESLDTASSAGLYELNHVLGRGPFGERQIAVKSGLMAAVVVGELLVVRHWPRAARALKWVNFGTAAVTAGAAAHNWAER